MGKIKKDSDLHKEIKIINRRMEETLSILIEHFKETEERLDKLEEKMNSNGT
jgi:uncharacterized membrane-anchored protein YhcB (DUF1043 family)